MKPNILCFFGVIDELILENIIIDNESSDAPFEFMPLHLQINENGVSDLHATSRSLSLKSCHIVPGNGILRLLHGYFKSVKTLELLCIASKYDLLLNDSFTSLKYLTIDCNSAVFINEALVDESYYYKSEVTNINDDPNDIETLLDVHVDNSLQASPQRRTNYREILMEEVFTRMDTDIINNFNNFKFYKDIPNVNLWVFLKSLSRFKSVGIKMLRKWLFCIPRSRYDWELLIKTVFNLNVPIEVCDYDGFLLYSYGEDVREFRRHLNNV